MTHIQATSLQQPGNIYINNMKKILLIIIAGTVALVSSCMQSESKPEVKSSKEPLNVLAQVERGKYLVNSMGCDDCHSPKKMGPHGPEIIDELRFSGYPSERPLKEVDKENLKKGWILFNEDLTSSVGPWGASFTANLTSDPTGIGSWTEENFINAIRHGKYKGNMNGRDLLPPMPWFVYKNLNDDDLKAILAFLKSTKPVHNVVPSPIPPDQL